MNIAFARHEHVGSRPEQQDFSLVSHPKVGQASVGEVSSKEGIFLALVADGMGGLDSGRIASSKAASTFREMFERYAADSQNDLKKLMKAAAQKASKVVFEESVKEGKEGEVGSTLVALAIKGNIACCVSVGDSRLYCMRNGIMEQITTDHSHRADLAESVRQGKKTRESAKQIDPHYGKLTSYLGEEMPSQIYQKMFEIKPGDRLLLCSDGLFTLKDQEIHAYLSQQGADQAARFLVEGAVAKAKKRQDNISVVTILVEPQLSVRPLPLPVLSNAPANLNARLSSSIAREDTYTRPFAYAQENPLDWDKTNSVPAYNAKNTRSKQATSAQIASWKRWLIIVPILCIGVLGAYFVYSFVMSDKPSPMENATVTSTPNSNGNGKVNSIGKSNSIGKGNSNSNGNSHSNSNGNSHSNSNSNSNSGQNVSHPATPTTSTTHPTTSTTHPTTSTTSTTHHVVNRGPIRTHDDE